MSLLFPALVGGVIAMAIALSIKPIETMLRVRRHARRGGWQLRRDGFMHLGYGRPRTRRRPAQAAPG